VQELGSKETIHETWLLHRRLSGHAMGMCASLWPCLTASDVFGLAWSPDSTHLVSCGVDHDVFVWNIASFGLLRVLDGGWW
jgi:WD40 repeat protein